MKQKDLEDAVDHANSFSTEYILHIDDFKKYDLGYVELDQLSTFDDFSSWVEFEPDELVGETEEKIIDALTRFRDLGFANRALKWIKENKFPAVVVITFPDEDGFQTVIGDGRGRINVAIAMGIKSLPTIYLKHKDDDFSIKDVKNQIKGNLMSSRLLAALNRITSDESSDIKQRSIARSALKDLREYIADNMEDISQLAENETYLSSYSEMKKAPFFWSKEGVLVIPMFNLSDEYDDLWVLLTGERGHHGTGKLRDMTVIKMNSVLKRPFDPTYADTRLNQDRFIHEFIHYLDSKRGVPGGSSKAFDAGDIKRYFNDPSEFNAYYQEALNAIENTLNNEAFVDKIVRQGGRQEFFDFIMGYFDKEFMANLEAKYKRKLLKRLGRFYTEVVQPMEKG